MRPRIFARSQTGTSHLSLLPSETFAPCQDAHRVVIVPPAVSRSRKEDALWGNRSICYILAVADGHGDTTFHPSSEHGAQIAVESATAVLAQLAAIYERDKDIRIFEQFPVRVVDEWRSRVMEHALKRFPEENLRGRFLHEEYELFRKKILMAYGSTLLSALWIPSEKILVTAQIGDGDMVLLSWRDEGRVPVKPVRGNPEHPYGGNASDSLCAPDAVDKFALKVFDGGRDEETGELLKKFSLLLATDGVSQIGSEEWFLDYCRPRMKAYMTAYTNDDYLSVEELMANDMCVRLPAYTDDDMTIVMMAVDEDRKRGLFDAET